MKLATFETTGGDRRVGGVIDADRSVLDLALAHELTKGAPDPRLHDMVALIDGGEPALSVVHELIQNATTEAVVGLAAVRLLSPLPEPRQIRDFLLFEDHLKNAAATREQQTGETYEIPAVFYEQPNYYKCNRFSVIGTDTDVRWPRISNLLDFELELACVIGRKGVDIPRERALEHVFGYTIFNDVSARDTQAREMAMGLGPAKGKDFDTGNVFGPWIVTSDEISDPHNLTMTARVNGEEWSRGSSKAMHHRFEDAIAHVSQCETIHPAELFGSGTVGTGCGLELGKFPQPGDVIELEIEKIGVLRNRFVKDGD